MTSILRPTMLTSVTLALLVSMITGCASTASNPNNVAATNTYGVPVTKRTLPQRLLDSSIERTARININGINQELADYSRVNIDSFYSDVLLTGEVPTDLLKQQIDIVVRSMPDVKEVYNQLTVSPDRGYSSTVHDGYITSKMSAQIAANPNIQNSQVKVVTNNGIAYIMGRMTPTQEGQLIDIAQKTVGVVEVVLLTSLINDYGEVLTEQDIMSESNLLPPMLVEPIDGNIGLSEPVYPNSTTTNIANGSADNSLMNQPTSPYIELYKDSVLNNYN